VLLLNEMLEYFLAIQPSQQTKDLLLEELLDGSEIYDWYLYDAGSESRIKTVIKHIMRLEEFQVSILRMKLKEFHANFLEQLIQ
ncbi:MAG: hypothetical protein CMG07_04670, partial [Candidatus Marinimicrobia bacterium]|nr:hypothetical protein [Candidatus Neomarinimicrobiota bacterium]